MAKKIVMFFDERLDSDFRMIRFEKCIPISQELNNVYMFMNNRNLWTKCKKKMRENQSHIKLKNQNNYNIKKGKKYVCCKKRFNEIRIFKLASYDVSKTG